MTQREISEQLSLSRQTLNSAFKQLIKKGLIRLEPLENDQRSKRAILTDEENALSRPTLSGSSSWKPRPGRLSPVRSRPC